MSSPFSWKAAGVVAASALAIIACGGSNAPAPGSKGTIVIGVDLPESGNEASNGIPTLNGVKFAVQQQGDLKGFKIEVLNFDDAVNGVHDPQKGAQNVNQMLSNPNLLAMIGPFNSNVARAEIPITNAAGLVMISPANTAECLTIDLPYCDPTPAKLRPTGKPNNYYRVAATDTRQGPAMADYAYDVLNLKSLAVGSDNETYGKGIANNFQKEFEKKGGKSVLRQDFDTKSTSDFRPFISSAKSKGAQGLYFGGTDSNKSCVVRSQMKGIFDAATPFMGGDGIVTAQCLKDAADNSVGSYGTLAAVDAGQVAEAQPTIKAFKAAFPAAGDYGGYTIPAYSATKAIFEAISTAIDVAKGSKPTREQVRDAMQKVKNLKTPIGTISFDSVGDVVPQIITVYSVKQASQAEAADSPACGTGAASSTCFVFAKTVNYTG
jgi:branched-chain amino acid transport system substrate-binding protein